jgi:hypothetical protein
MEGMRQNKSKIELCVTTGRRSILTCLHSSTGVIPVFRTEPSTIFVFRKVRNDVEEQAHRGADDCGGQADGSGGLNGGELSIICMREMGAGHFQAGLESEPVTPKQFSGRPLCTR